MGRGSKSEIGDKNVNRNGYEYTKTERGWVGSHILMIEEELGRQLEPGEYVAFKPGVPKTPVVRANIELRRRGDSKKSNKARIAQIDARIEELKAERKILMEEEGANV